MTLNLLTNRIALFDPEQRKNVKVMFTCPNTGDIRTELVKYLLSSQHEIDTIFLPQKNPGYICANFGINHFLEQTECTHLLSMDSDIKPFSDTVPRMLNMLDLGFDVCCCVVPIFDIRIHGFKMGAGRQLKDGKWTYLQISNEVEAVDFVGGAYWMAKRKVLEKIPAPWFDIILDKRGMNGIGADLYFSNKIRKYGFKMCA